MRFLTISAIVSFTVIGASAAPEPWGGWGGWRDWKPPTTSQKNICGNGVTAYCCNNQAFAGGSVDCNPMDQSGVCDTTIVCCNADDSVQVCVGDINIDL